MGPAEGGGKKLGEGIIAKDDTLRKWTKPGQKAHWPAYPRLYLHPVAYYLADQVGVLDQFGDGVAPGLLGLLFIPFVFSYAINTGIFEK